MKTHFIELKIAEGFKAGSRVLIAADKVSAIVWDPGTAGCRISTVEPQGAAYQVAESPEHVRELLDGALQ